MVFSRVLLINNSFQGHRPWIIVEKFYSGFNKTPSEFDYLYKLIITPTFMSGENKKQ